MSNTDAAVLRLKAEALAAQKIAMCGNDLEPLTDHQRSLIRLLLVSMYADGALEVAGRMVEGPRISQQDQQEST